MREHDGGPAFPVKSTSPDRRLRALGYEDAVLPVTYEGMSLRDYFACAALQVIGVTSRIQKSDAGVEACAVLSYRLADAMLVEREKGGA